MSSTASAIATDIEYYPSANGTDRVAAHFFPAPKGAVRAVVQLSHGMVEHIPRYADLAQVLTQHGFAVCGNDHLGHGATSGENGLDGFFAPKDGAAFVLQDLRAMTAAARRRWPGVPLVLLGHSMGSFFARWYAQCWGADLAALVLSGTAGPNPAAGLGFALTGALSAVCGPRAHIAAIDRMMFGSYCKRIPNAPTGKEWVTGDAAQLAAYLADPKCGFPFTVSADHEMLRVLRIVSRRGWAASLPQQLPVLLLSGALDPVGGYGKGVRQVAQRLADAGVQDVTLQLFKGCRHEVHHESPAAVQRFYDALLGWLDARLPG